MAHLVNDGLWLENCKRESRTANAWRQDLARTAHGDYCVPGLRRDGSRFENHFPRGFGHAEYNASPFLKHSIGGYFNDVGGVHAAEKDVAAKVTAGPVVKKSFADYVREVEQSSQSPQGSPAPHIARSKAQALGASLSNSLASTAAPSPSSSPAPSPRRQSRRQSRAALRSAGAALVGGTQSSSSSARPGGVASMLPAHFQSMPLSSTAPTAAAAAVEAARCHKCGRRSRSGSRSASRSDSRSGSRCRSRSRSRG